MNPLPPGGELSLIVAVSTNGIIGANGGIPWRIPEDFKFFKATTLGHSVIMGRKTFESIGKPLPNRHNIVLSKGIRLAGLDIAPKNGAVGLSVCLSLDAALKIAYETDVSPFIIGGSAVYAEAMPLVTRMYVTEVHRVVEGDMRFPDFDRSEWREVARNDGAECSWVTLERK